MVWGKTAWPRCASETSRAFSVLLPKSFGFWLALWLVMPLGHLLLERLHLSELLLWSKEGRQNKWANTMLFKMSLNDLLSKICVCPRNIRFIKTILPNVPPLEISIPGTDHSSVSATDFLALQRCWRVSTIILRARCKEKWDPIQEHPWLGFKYTCTNGPWSSPPVHYRLPQTSLGNIYTGINIGFM